MKAAAALLLLATGGAALASGTIELDPKFEEFDSRVACEKALKRRHGAALARLAALPPAERRANRVEALGRDRDEHLGYFEVLDLTGEASDTIMPESQTEAFTCRGRRLEHRIQLDPVGERPAPLSPPAPEGPKP